MRKPKKKVNAKGLIYQLANKLAKNGNLSEKEKSQLLNPQHLRKEKPVIVLLVEQYQVDYSISESAKRGAVK
jgi:hypothetical protein